MRSRSHFEALADLREQLAAMGKDVGDEDYTDTLFILLHGASVVVVNDLY